MLRVTQAYSAHVRCDKDLATSNAIIQRGLPALLGWGTVRRLAFTVRGLSFEGERALLRALQHSARGLLALSASGISLAGELATVFTELSTAATLEHLSVSVEAFRLVLEGHQQWWAPTVSLEQLRALTIDAALTDAELPYLSTMPLLEHLSITNAPRLCGTDPAAWETGPLARLRSLDLSGCARLQDDALLALNACRRHNLLERIVLRDCRQVTTAGLAAFGPLPLLRHLDVSRTAVGGCGPLLDKGSSLAVCLAAGCPCLDAETFVLPVLASACLTLQALHLGGAGAAASKVVATWLMDRAARDLPSLHHITLDAVALSRFFSVRMAWRYPSVAAHF